MPQMANYYHGYVTYTGVSIDLNPHFYVMTVAAGSALMYLDGVLVGSNLTVALASQGAGVLSIGGNGSSQLWPGVISQTMFWNGRALDANCVRQLFLNRYCMIAPPCTWR